MMTNEKNAICLAINEQYVGYAKILIKSLIQNNKWFNYDIIVVGDDSMYISEQSLNELKSIYPNIVQKTFQKTKKLFLFLRKFVPHIEYINWAYAYLKLYAFEIDDYDKILFLDADMVINGNISEIFQSNDDIDICIDMPQIKRNKNIVNNEYLQLQNKWGDYNGEYFNVGVIYYGNKAFRKKLKNEFFDFALEYDFKPIKFKETGISKIIADGRIIEQDMLNYYILSHIDEIKCRLLPLKYNVNNTNGLPYLLDNAVIIHYWMKPFNILTSIKESKGFYNYSMLLSSLRSIKIYNKYLHKNSRILINNTVKCIVLNNVNKNCIYTYICSILFNDIYNNMDTFICINSNKCIDYGYSIMKNEGNIYFYCINFNDYGAQDIMSFMKSELHNIYDNINVIVIDNDNFSNNYENDKTYKLLVEQAYNEIFTDEFRIKLYNKLSSNDKLNYVNKKVLQRLFQCENMII